MSAHTLNVVSDVNSYHYQSSGVPTFPSSLLYASIVIFSEIMIFKKWSPIVINLKEKHHRNLQIHSALRTFGASISRLLTYPQLQLWFTLTAVLKLFWIYVHQVSWIMTPKLG